MARYGGLSRGQEIRRLYDRLDVFPALFFSIQTGTYISGNGISLSAGLKSSLHDLPVQAEISPLISHARL